MRIAKLKTGNNTKNRPLKNNQLGSNARKFSNNVTNQALMPAILRRSQLVPDIDH